MELEQLQSLIAGSMQQSQADGSLVSVRAGICTQQGTTVSSDSRKGRLVLCERDGLLHVQWKLRPSNDIQQDYIVMPNEATIELIPECTEGRVVLIDFPDDPSRRHFYWLQEPQKANDAQIVEQIQGYFSGRTPFSGRNAVQDSAAAISSRTNLNQNELLALLTGGAASQRNRLQASNHTGPAGPVQDLAAVLDPEHLLPILQANPDIVEALLDHLPQGQRSQDQLYAQLRSPQLHQTLNRLTMAINSGQGFSLLQQFGISLDDGVGISAMLQAIIRQARNNTNSGS